LAILLSNVGLLFVPLPLAALQRTLSGRYRQGGTLEFYSHPSFVCTMHLVWLGWLVTAGALYDSYAPAHGWPQIPFRDLSWPWLAVLLVTILIMGLNFNRVAVALLCAVAVIIALALALLQVWEHEPIYQSILWALHRIPVRLDWGVPFVVSLVLGITFVLTATWRRMNDRWILEAEGNFLQHATFQQKDVEIAKGFKTILAVYPCLIKRYLFFGLGNIVISPGGEDGPTVIEGVFFAKHHEHVIKHRFGTTDVHAVTDREEFVE
jgi:hypothetical protein